MLRYQIDIFENSDRHPVVSHIFYGNTLEEVSGVVKAHRKTDSFLNAALSTRTFQGIKLRAQDKWLSNI